MTVMAMPEPKLLEFQEAALRHEAVLVGST